MNTSSPPLPRLRVARSSSKPPRSRKEPQSRASIAAPIGYVIEICVHVRKRTVVAATVVGRARAFVSARREVPHDRVRKAWIDVMRVTLKCGRKRHQKKDGVALPVLQSLQWDIELHGLDVRRGG